MIVQADKVTAETIEPQTIGQPSLLARLKPFWRPETGIFLAVWLVLMIGGRTRFFRDPGTFWHTVVGEQMLSTGSMIYTDTFSFTFAGKPWIAHQWLGECVMALLHRVDGFDTLLLAATTLLAWVYTWIAARLIRCGLHWSLAIVVVGLIMAASSSHFHVRPHLGTIALLACTYALLCDFEARRAGVGNLAFLVPIFLLWTNAHGGMLGGLGTLVIVWTGWEAQALLGKGALSQRQMLIAAALLIACGFTAFASPYGLLMPKTWFAIMDSPILPQIIQEHARLNPLKLDGMMVIALGVFYVFMLSGTLLRGSRWPRVTWLIPLVWLLLACSRIRHAPLLAVTAGFAIADMLPFTCWARWMARPGSDLFVFPKTAQPTPRKLDFRAALVPVGILAIVLIMQIRRVPCPVLGHGWARCDQDACPADLTAALRQAAPAGEPVPIFNEYQFGGFLIYESYFTPNFPQYRVFVDDRCELYGDRWLQNYVVSEWEDTAAQIQRWQQSYGRFDLALTRRGSGFDGYFAGSADWKLLAGKDGQAHLYRRPPGGNSR
jgi:hypothetical protein